MTIVTLGAAGIAIGGIAGCIIMGAAIGTLVLGTTGAAIGVVGGMIYDAINGNDFGTSIWTWTKAGFGIGAIAGAIIGGAIGGMAGSAAYGTTKITWLSSRLHAGQRMLQRGVKMNDIVKVLKSGAYIKQSVDKYLVMGKITAVITTTGQLITVWYNSSELRLFFEIIKQFFGG